MRSDTSLAQFATAGVGKLKLTFPMDQRAEKHQNAPGLSRRFHI